MAIKFKDILDSAFFNFLMRLRVNIFSDDYYEDQDMLMYKWCPTKDERIIATRDVIKKLRNKIRKLRTESLCLDYLELRTSVNETFIELTNDGGTIKYSYFWEDYFTDYFLENVNSLTPITDEKARIKEKIEKQLYDEEYYKLLANQRSYSLDSLKIMKYEKEIMQKIELDIEGIKRTIEYELVTETLKNYIHVSKPLAFFYNISDSLILLRRLEKFERILEEDLKENELLHKTVDTSCLQCPVYSQLKGETHQTSNGNSLNKTKTIADFLIGSEPEKLKLLEFIKTNYLGEKGKTIAIMILALKEARMICYDNSTKLYSALRNDLGNIGTNAGINKQMTDVRLKDKELMKTVSLHVEKLRKHMETV